MLKCRYEVHVDTDASRRSRQRRRMLAGRRRNSQRRRMLADADEIDSRKVSSIALAGELADAVTPSPAQ